MEMQEGLKALEKLLDPYDWFYEVEAEARRYVVYVTYMTPEQNSIVPDYMMGHQVVVHFAGAKLASKEQFMNTESRHSELLRRVESVRNGEADTLSLDEVERDLVDLDIPDTSITALTRELDRLEKMCGSNTLQDIFYEVHDKQNAVTNLSSRYPVVRESMEKLYRTYGFNTIYEELDG